MRKPSAGYSRLNLVTFDNLYFGLKLVKGLLLSLRQFVGGHVLHLSIWLGEMSAQRKVVRDCEPIECSLPPLRSTHFRVDSHLVLGCHQRPLAFLGGIILP